MALRELFARFGVQFDTGALNQGNQSIGSMVGGLRNLGAALAGAAIIRGLNSFIDEVREMGDELDKTGIQLGISTQAMQEWRFAAGLAGVDGAAFSQSLALLQRNAVEAASGTGAQADAFRELGINVRDASGEMKDGSTLLEETGLAIGALENPTERVALSLELMGRSGRRLLPLFTDGAEGLAAARGELEQLGGGLSQDVIDQTVILTDEQLRLETAMTSLKGRLALQLLPTLNRFVQFMTGAVAAFADLTAGTHIAQLAMAALGVAAIALAVKMLAGFAVPIAIGLLVAAIIGIIILVVDDLITLFEGGESVIGAFIDAMFGIGTAQQWVEDLTAAWEGLTLAIRRGLAALRGEELPTASGRAVTAAESATIHQRQSALSGRVTRTAAERERGVTFEQALERTNAIRAEENVAALQVNEEGVLESVNAGVTRGRGSVTREAVRQGAQVRARAGRGGVTENTVEQGDINVTVAGGRNPRELAEQITAAVRREQGTNLRATMDALIQEADDDDD